MTRGIVALGAFLIWATGVQAGGVTHRILEYADLDGWSGDDHAAAFDVFLSTCGDMAPADWQSLCAIAETQDDPRRFFELFFRPILIEDGRDMLFTGYFEPELRGARYRGGPYQHPIYSLPEDLERGETYATRAEIANGRLAGRGLEIAWLADPVDAFFLHIQGSGRIKLAGGGVIRVGYAGKNGHEYRSVGEELVRRGIFEPHEVSMDVIRSWVAENGAEGQDLLNHNASYVFFREVSHVPAGRGPLGAMNRSITTGRSLAVDPGFVPLGAPVWIEKDGASPVRRLMIAQDTGSAIKGPQRADIFVGTGPEAGRAAGRIKDGGRMLVLMPIQRAYALDKGL